MIQPNLIFLYSRYSFYKKQTRSLEWLARIITSCIREESEFILNVFEIFASISKLQVFINRTNIF